MNESPANSNKSEGGDEGGIISTPRN